MDIRTGFDGLRSLLGVAQPSPSEARTGKSGASQESSPVATDVAKLSSAGSQVAQSGWDSGIRTEKVESIQAALAAGTYDVPAAALASKLVDVMLARGQ